MNAVGTFDLFRSRDVVKLTSLPGPFRKLWIRHCEFMFVSSVVPSPLPRCPREVWEGVSERTRSRRVSLGDVTAHSKVQV